MKNEMLSKALKLFEEKSFIKARDIFLDIADENVIALYYLGAIYRMGLGIQDDQKEAFKWFLRAAEKGHAESQHLVGCAYSGKSMMFGETEIVYNDYKRIQFEADIDQSIWQDSLPYYDLNGAGVEPNEEIAFEWVLKAANQGYAIAQVRLGIFYEIGIGVDRDNIEALKWYNKAASQQNPQAMRMQAFSIFDQDGDLQKRIELLKKAYDLGDERSAFVLGKTYEKYSCEQDHFEKAFEWYKVSADKFDYFESHQKLADFLHEGRGVKRDLSQAIIEYRKAIEAFKKEHYGEFFGKAYEKLYDLYSSGYKEAITEIEIIEYLKDAANYKDESSLMRLKVFFEKGFDVGDKYKKIFELVNKADQGDKHAQIEYGYIYIANRFIEDSTKSKVKDWFLEDAVNGNPDAQFLLSQIYTGPTYGAEHIFWLKKAADQGYSRAQYELALALKNDTPSKALKYMKLASERYIYAQIDLGYDYAHGIIVNKDYQEAYRIYQKAASNMKGIKDIYELRTINYVKFRYNAANDEAEHVALNGHVYAQLYMGCLYQYGFEVKRNRDKAIFWYEMATKLGNNEAQIQLDLIHNEWV